MPHHRHRQESIPGIEPEADSSPSDFVRSGASPAWRGSGARAGIPAGRPSPPGFVLRLPRHASRPAAAAILAAKSALGGCSVLPDHPGFRPDNEASWWRCARDEPPEHLRDLERWRYSLKVCPCLPQSLGNQLLELALSLLQSLWRSRAGLCACRKRDAFQMSSKLCVNLGEI